MGAEVHTATPRACRLQVGFRKTTFPTAPRQASAIRDTLDRAGSGGYALSPVTRPARLLGTAFQPPSPIFRTHCTPAPHKTPPVSSFLLVPGTGWPRDGFPVGQLSVAGRPGAAAPGAGGVAVRVDYPTRTVKGQCRRQKQPTYSGSLTQLQGVYPQAMGRDAGTPAPRGRPVSAVPPIPRHQPSRGAPHI
jgi:hypothetical protein